MITYILEFPGLARQSLGFTWCSPGSLMWLDVQDGFSHLTGAAVMTRGQAGLSPLLHVISLLLNSSAKASLNGGWILRKKQELPGLVRTRTRTGSDASVSLFWLKQVSGLAQVQGEENRPLLLVEEAAGHIQGKEEFLVSIFCNILPQGNRCLEFPNKRSFH